MPAAAWAGGRIVMPCHQSRHNPVWMKVKEWLASGAIGRWHLAEFSVYRTTADPGRVADGTPWRGTSAAGRGGVLLDHGTHLVRSGERRGGKEGRSRWAPDH